jgi:threonine/homoserine/homoserine lactone efflux protein
VLPFLAAMWIGEAAWLTSAVAGLAAIAETFHYAFVAIKWVGVCYLFYLAWKMWFASSETGDETLPEAKLFFAGLTVALGNPKIMMFYMALLQSIIDIRSATVVGWAELVVTMLLVLIVVDIGWALLAARQGGLGEPPCRPSGQSGQCRHNGRRCRRDRNALAHFVCCVMCFCVWCFVGLVFGGGGGS